MKLSHLALRLQPSLLEETRRTAEQEGMPLDQFISAAISDKLSATRTARYFSGRAAGGNTAKAVEILNRAGTGKAPDPGDELL